MSPKADEVVAVFGELFIDEPLPRNGYIELPDKPGWGVNFNKNGLVFRRPYAREV